MKVDEMKLAATYLSSHCHVESPSKLCGVLAQGYGAVSIKEEEVAADSLSYSELKERTVLMTWLMHLRCSKH